MLSKSVERLLTMIQWECSNCQTANETSLLIWNDLKYRLICRECSFMQDYPNYISKVDPEPPRRFRV